MPIYRYEPKAPAEGDTAKTGCALCRDGFETAQRMSDPPLASCPECGTPVVKVPVISAVGRSQSSLDDRAKSAGFSKLKRISKGEYEKQY